MEYNFAKKEVKRISRNRIIISIIAIIALIAIIYFNFGWINNLFIKEEKFEAGSELQTLIESSHMYVKTDADELFYTGNMTRKDAKKINRYYAFYAEDMYVVCKEGNVLEEYKYSYYNVKGWLKEPTTEENKMITKIANQIAEDQSITLSEAKKLVSPYIIDITPPKITHQLMAGACILGILYFVYLIVKSVSEMTDYRRNKSYKKMKIDKEEGSEEQRNEEISRDFEDNSFIFKNKIIRITSKWVVSKSFASFTVLPTSDLVWTYKVITQHRTNGIPTGKSYSVKLLSKNRKTFDISVSSESKADDMVQLMGESFPNVILGYSIELLNLYQKDMETFSNLKKEFEKQTARENKEKAKAKDLEKIETLESVKHDKDDNSKKSGKNKI